MKRTFSYIFLCILRFVLLLRYRIRVKGLEGLEKKGGTLILANHPAEIDPPILMSVLWSKFKPRPIALDSLFLKRFVGRLLRFIDALPVPNFEDSSNSFKRKKIEETYLNMRKALKQGQSLLIYPSGCLKHQAEEVIGGASGVHRILQQEPQVQVLLVRTTGLWGSSFSRALTGKSPEIGPAFWQGFKVLLKNGFFFAPRRVVTVECEMAPADFARHSDRRSLNMALENWYNAKGEEKLNLVSYSFWKYDIPKIKVHKGDVGSISLEKIPQQIQEEIRKEIASLGRYTKQEVEPERNLAQDLGLDSLDVAQLCVLLKEKYGVASVRSTDLTTVQSVMAFAAHLKKPAQEEENHDQSAGWSKEENRPSVELPEGNSIIEAFLRRVDKMPKYAAAVDVVSGEVSYHRMKLSAILLAKKFAKYPEKRIGVMLPASVAVNVVIMALLLANKVPVMINWTLGPRNLRHVVDESKIKRVLSSWSFLDRLENSELDGIDDRIVLLEEVKRKISLFDKLVGLFLARKKYQALLSSFRLTDIKRDDPAVILFTSGTENVPKGVPLSHANIIENLRGAAQLVSFFNTDVLLGILPPFHSFGFSVTGLMPLLLGMRVVFSPNPTDGRRIVRAVRRWRVTLICIAPTFLKNVLRAATKAQVKSLRLVVSGAEKAPRVIFDKLAELNAKAKLIEGYGITECSPVLSINPPESPAYGVGRPLPGVEFLVIHPETRDVLKRGQTGLILAKGPNVFSGYLNPHLASPFVTIKGRSWYETGDLGFLNEKGYLVLSGRLKRFIKIGGEMISLAAVEEALYEGEHEAGWRLPEDGPALAVIAKEEEGKKGEIILFTTIDTTLEEVNRILRARGMSNLVRISKLFKLHALPLLGSGKVDYRQLAQNQIQSQSP